MSEKNEQPTLWAELKAMAREAVKDIRDTVVSQGWFGQREGPGEPGTPLNPMYAEVAQERGVLHGHQPIEMEGPQQSYMDALRQQRPPEEPDRGMGR